MFSYTIAAILKCYKESIKASTFMEVQKGCNFTNSFIHIHWKHKPKNIFYRIYELKVSPTRNIKAVFLHIHSCCQCCNYTTIMESSIKHSILQPAVLSQQTVSIACPEKRRRRRGSRISRASWRTILSCVWHSSCLADDTVANTYA